MDLEEGRKMAKLLHTRVRVSDLDRSINWYCENLGFKVKSRSDSSPAGNHIAHLELPGNEHTLELTWSEDYELNVPEDLLHFAIGYPDLYEKCEELEAKGLEIWPDDWQEKVRAGKKMTFITDPDNYEVELLERK